MPKLGRAQYCPHTDGGAGEDWYGNTYSIGRNPANHSCNGGPLHDGPSRVLTVQISQFPKEMPKCDEIIGNKCAPGYIESGCAKCCKDCTPDPEAEECFKKDQNDPSCFSLPPNGECTAKGNCGIVGRIYYKPSTGANKGTCQPCKSKPSWVIALVVASVILIGTAGCAVIQLQSSLICAS